MKINVSSIEQNQRGLARNRARNPTDFNAAINIGSRFLAAPLTRQGADGSPYAGDEQAREIVARKPRSPHPFTGGSESQHPCSA